MIVVRVLGALALLTVPAIAAAQATASSSWSGLGPLGFPLPQIAPALPPIGLPLTPLGLSPGVDRPTPAPLPSSPPRRPGLGRPDGRPRLHPRSTIVYVEAPYSWFDAAPAPPTSYESPAAEPPMPTGHLRLELQPAPGVQVFVDREFVGMLDETGDLELAPGTRRVEIRADGYDTLIFDARIAAGRIISYRGALVPQTTPPPPTAAAAPFRPEGQIFYLIPGCYLGNIPPEQVRLPAGCDLSRMITHRP